jgi:L-threonylcarbamoyladenylate synthase
MTKPERIALNTLLESSRSRKKLEEIAHSVSKGAIFVYPTETIYGIGGAYNVHGVKEKIFSAKQRTAPQPMILIASDQSCFSKLSITFPPSAERLAHYFWPGMLTLVLPSSNQKSGIAVRVSGHPFIKKLFRYIDEPIYSTSANLSGKAYINDPERIYSIFSDDIDFFIDAGPLPASAASTVVKIDDNNMITVLREGAISFRSIEKALKKNVLMVPHRGRMYTDKKESPLQ